MKDRYICIMHVYNTDENVYYIQGVLFVVVLTIKFHPYIILYYEIHPLIPIAVSGEANFAMQHTELTLGGFTQPCVARNMLENTANVEKGLCQRFLWLVPETTTVAFKELQCVDSAFTTEVS